MYRCSLRLGKHQTNLMFLGVVWFNAVVGHITTVIPLDSQRVTTTLLYVTAYRSV